MDTFEDCTLHTHLPRELVATKYFLPNRPNGPIWSSSRDISPYPADYLVPLPCNFFWGLSLVLRSHDHFEASHRSTLIPSDLKLLPIKGVKSARKYIFFFFSEFCLSSTISLYLWFYPHRSRDAWSPVCMTFLVWSISAERENSGKVLTSKLFLVGGGGISKKFLAYFYFINYQLTTVFLEQPGLLRVH